jgi:hypothetical protein
MHWPSIEDIGTGTYSVFLEPYALVTYTPIYSGVDGRANWFSIGVTTHSWSFDVRLSRRYEIIPWVAEYLIPADMDPALPHTFEVSILDGTIVSGAFDKQPVSRNLEPPI